MTTVLVCGGRKFGLQLDEYRFISNMLSLYFEEHEITRLVTGMASGVDKVADDWAQAHGMEVGQYPISEKEWQRYGRAAGPKRNQRMFDEENIDLVIAFPGGAGTRDTVHRALVLGVPVKSFRYPGGYQHAQMVSREGVAYVSGAK